MRIRTVSIKGEDGTAYICADKITMVQVFKHERKVLIRYADVVACEHTLNVKEGDPEEIGAEVAAAWIGGPPPGREGA